jgi:hypothetical protein
MDLTPSEVQADLRAGLGALLAKESTTDRVRAAELAGGFDPELWAVLNDFGVPQLADSALLADLVVVAEVAGFHLASAPVVESLVAVRLFGRLGLPVTDTLVSFSPRPGSGPTVRTVAGAAAGARVLALHDGALIRTATGAGILAPPQPLSAIALADVDTAGCEVLAEGVIAADAYRAALADWRILTAAALAGVSARAIALGVTYAKERHQFGQPIGAFQAVQHLLANVATSADGALLLVQEAAWATDHGSKRSLGLAAAAFTFGTVTAQETCAASLHVHGGYGYTTEYDIQRYFRRAKALALLGGGSNAALEDVAELALAGVN